MWLSVFLNVRPEVNWMLEKAAGVKVTVGVISDEQRVSRTVRRNVKNGAA